jgi:hypothetical protein
VAWRGFFGRSTLWWVVGLALGAAWWWAVWRLAWGPEKAGVVEGVVAAGGWGLSLLPVHCMPWPPSTAKGADGPAAAAAGRGSSEPSTRASRLRRSTGGSGPS